MKPASSSLALAGTLLACGPEAPAVAELGEVCGGDGPFRVLALEPDEVLRFNRPLRVGERVFYVTSRRLPDDPRSEFPRAEPSAVWTTGPCGESPVRVADGISNIFTLDIWPDVVLGCHEATGSVVALDPTGATEPHVVFPDVSHNDGCGLNWTPHGVLSVEDYGDERGALLLHPYPADPRSETAAPIVLLDPVSLTPSGNGGSGIVANVIRTFDEFVLALTPDRQLRRVDLADGLVTVLQDNVLEIEASRAGRYLLWQDATELPGGDPKHPEGKIFLRDLDDGSDALLHETALAYSMFPLQWADEGLVQLGLGYVNRDPKRLFFLPDLDHRDVPASLFLNAKLDEDRWLGGSLSESRYNVIDLRTGETTPLFSRKSQGLHLDGDALVLLEVPRCCIEAGYREEGPIWRVPLDGGEPEQLARRATRGVARLPDGRYVSPLELDAGWLGPLVLIDPATGAEARIDERVFSFSLDTSRDDGVITYSVSDGDRSGVYLAKLPAGGTVTERAAIAPHPVVFDPTARTAANAMIRARSDRDDLHLAR